MIRLFAVWDNPSWTILERLERKRLQDAWVPRIGYRLRLLARMKIIPTARSLLKRRYDWTGKAAASLRITGVARGGSQIFMDIGTELVSGERAFGQWAASPFVYPTGLHEGIKGHRVWIKRPGLYRRGLAAWAKAHNIPEPEGQYWSIRVYRRGRKKSAVPFLYDAVMHYHRQEIEWSILGAIDSAIQRKMGALPLGLKSIWV